MESNIFPAPPARTRRVSKWGDLIFRGLTGVGGFALVGLIFALIVVLYVVAEPTITRFGFSFLWRSVWDPNRNIYGAVPIMLDTLLTSAIALLIAVPLSVGAAIFLTQQAPRWLADPVGQVVELLAAVPSIVFGFWGIIVLVPIMRYTVEPWLKTWLGWTGLFSETPIGIDILTASVVLSIMIVPTITAISRDAMAAVPTEQREGALSLGATDWEATRRVVVPYAQSGVFGGIILGLGRALGETMAVTLVIGNVFKIPISLISQGQTMASEIANEFTEASGPLEYSALVETGLVLLLITFLVNLAARVVLWRFARGGRIGGMV
ncbi:MAG TPA: phosphate ABC transporter permease subunit PstC [Thermoplasmata archaeon]|nr:phosphate ABC transporter permease subunit PstC [Thermoplasmata archaeon]